MKTRWMLAVVAAVGLLNVLPVSGQTARPWDPTGLQLTRQELQELLARFEETSNSSAYSGKIRSYARDEAALIRQRLEEGDIRVGDQITLEVEGQQTLTKDFTVVAGRKIVLPDLGEVPLTGVLRSELQPHLAAYIARFVVNPTVRARSAIRLEITGAVGKPGFYMVPSDMLLSEVLMQAGGPSGTASMENVRIKRGREVIWDGERVREAMIEGRTLDQLSVRAGDGIDVPTKTSKLTGLRSVMVGVSSVLSLAFLGRRVGLW